MRDFGYNGRMSNPSATALRSRLYRQRRQAGISVVPIQIQSEVLSALVECAFLDEVNKHNRGEIAEAVEFLLDLLAEGALLMDDSAVD